MSQSAPTENDRSEAAKTLVEFVANYSLVLEDLLESIRKDMADTVEQVMEQLGKANQTSVEHKAKASQVIKGNTIDSIEGEAKKANEASTEEILAKSSVAAKADFINKMDSLQNLDQRIQKLMMTMMGALSADDVVGHRIRHTKLAIALLGKGLAKVVQDVDGHFTRAEVAELNKEICKKVHSAYSSEEERAFFYKIFGKESEE